MVNSVKKSSIGIQDLRKFTQAVQDQYGIDFGHYAMSSLQRRVLRILLIYKLDTIDDLISKLKSDQSFFDELIEEITVNTTEMFRDPSMWIELKKELEARVKDNNTIRIWHAGCSSGEEVYSMAILLKEMNLLDKVKVFATDINENVIEKAKLGQYSIKNTEINTSNYNKYNPESDFTKYFETDEKVVKMDKSLISAVHFRNHNLTSLESFSKFDIILCRNVMIYFDKVLQDKVFDLFHESLYKFGLLVIGAKESLVWCSISNKFRLLNEKERLYQKVID